MFITFSTLSLFLLFQCVQGLQPTFQSRLKRDLSDVKSGEENVIVKTGSGFIQGFPMKIPHSRRIFAFTGVPYGDKPGRFQPPRMRRPWEGVWQATSPSPYCIQSATTTGFIVTGQEDCLFLDVYTPTLNNKRKLPVIIALALAGFTRGQSRTYGPAMFLQEEVILVVINIRQGIYGWGTSGDEACLGNWGLKDQLLAVEWVHKNILQFGGNPEKIVIFGISSGGALAGLMPFVSHPAKNYVTGIISSDAVPFNNNYLSNRGEGVEKFTKMIARVAGCRRSSSAKMVDCLKKINPYVLSNIQLGMEPFAFSQSSYFAPVVEGNYTNAVLPELPSQQYKTGKVSPIPWIMGRGENESSLITIVVQLASPSVLPGWRQIAPNLLKMFLPQESSLEIVGREERLKSLNKLCQLYFGKNGWPMSPGNFLKYVNLLDDGMLSSHLWRGVKYHHTIAPTYVYTTKLQIVEGMDFGLFGNSILYPVRGLGASHGTDTYYLFNSTAMTDSMIKLSPEIKTSVRNLLNLFVNFAATGKPLYRTESGNMVDVWKPVTQMQDPISLEVGLVHEIKMFKEPLVGSRRYQIWEELRV